MRDEIISLAQKLIQIESVRENKIGLQEVLGLVKIDLSQNSMVEFEDSGVPGLFFSNRKNNTQQYKVILNAHLDVVPGSAEQFKPFLRDGRLYGRGAYDMKAAAAVEILVFRELAEKLTYPLGLQLVTDEEVGGFCGTKYQVDQGIRAEFIIVGEPTNLDIGHKAKGILWTKILFRGESAHGAYLWQGKNAIWEMERFLEQLKSVYPVPTEEVWQTTVNVAQVMTENSVYNKVPDKCELKLDVRFVPEDKDLVLDKIKKLLPDGAEMEVILQESSQYTESNNPYLVQLQKCCSETRGADCEVIARHGGSDLRFFDQVGGKGVEFGPVGYGHHTDEEWVEVESLERYYEILKSFLLSLDGV